MDKRVPEVRFKGFTDDWEQLQLKNIFNQIVNYIDPKENGIPLWSLTVEKGLTPKTQRYNRNFLVKKNDKFKLVKNNEFIYNPMNMTLGAVDLNQTGKNVAVSGYYLTMSAKENYNNLFLLNWLKTSKTIQLYKRYATGTLTEKQRVQFPTFEQIFILLPKLDEQKRIGSLLSNLENTIILYQEQLKLYKKIRKSLLQTMFPKDGEKAPKVRFADFHDDWGQHKLGETLSLLKDGTHGTHRNVENGPYLLSAKNIKNGQIEITKDDRKISINDYRAIHKNFKLKKLDVLLTIVGSIGQSAVLQNPQNITFQRSVAYLRTKRMNPYFLNSIINTEVFQNNLKRKTVLSAQSGIYLGELSKIMISIPSRLDEQQKISNVISKMDNSIVHYKNELDKLIKVKHFLLQEMFI